jgi:indolepyruvate ferredoxin oxidoreductase, beta subunit
LNNMTAHLTTTSPISLLLCALGGEGGGVLKDWLVDVAHQAGHAAQATSIPGVAQRTGATTYYVEIHPQPLAQLNGRLPVFGLNPLPGRLDVLLASELLEATRQIVNGMTTADRTLVISSTARSLTVSEKTAMGDGRRDEAGLRSVIQQYSRSHHLVDMPSLTRQAGTIVSAVMLGTLAASGALPFDRADYEVVIGADGATASASLRGFALGFEAVQAQRQQASWVSEVLADAGEESTTPAYALPSEALAPFPVAAHALVSLASDRLRDYQDEAYARLYRQRLQAVWTAEQSQDTDTGHGAATTCEMARWLALWMAFDDVVRVADLKSRRQRWERVQREVKAQPGDLLKLYDHFKPGIPELAGLLPEPWAQALIRWDRRRVQKGQTPWALPLKIGTHSVGGMLALRGLAAMRRFRRWGSRFQREQALIERWWQAVIDGASVHWALGHELALCGRLIKGYGSTNERGKDNLLHIIDHLAQAPHLSPEARAQAVAAARQAALTDEAGQALDATLLRAGAPARPVREQPIRWMRRPPSQPDPIRHG